MAVYRFITEKRSPINEKFVNVYYFNLVSDAVVAARANMLSSLEADIHGSTVDFYNVHVDAIGSSWFTNIPQLITGVIAASTPVKSNVVARVTWGVPGYYPHYKDYRLHLTGSAFNGIEWNSTVQTALSNFASAMDSEFTGEICTKDGTLLDAPVAETEYFFRNTTNRWHNRA